MFKEERSRGEINQAYDKVEKKISSVSAYLEKTLQGIWQLASNYTEVCLLAGERRDDILFGSKDQDLEQRRCYVNADSIN